MVPCKIHHYHLGTCCHCNQSLLGLERATTQKARSVAALLKHLPQGEHIPTPVALLCKATEVALVGELPHQVFARPCPPTPRPGFVESRPCKSETDLQAVVKETFEADEEAEIMLMPPIEAAWNYIITPGQFVIGPGNAGATAGKASRAFPINHEVDPIYQKVVNACVLKGEAPHFELVVTGGKAAGNKPGACNDPDCWQCHPSSGNARWWTQCRSGPEVPGCKDFVPAATVVAAVVKPCDNLLEWEETCQAGFPPGTVVDGSGHSLASHAALHSIANKIPFITSHSPQQGEALLPEVPKWSLDAFAEGVGYGLTMTPKGSPSGYGGGGKREDILLLLYGLHHAPALVGSDTFYIGLASAIMFRWGLAAAEVEWEGDSKHSLPKSGTTYETILQKPKEFLTHRQHLPAVIDGFFQDDHEAGWGGRHWGRCAYSLLKLDESVRQALRAWRTDPEADATAPVGAVVAALNKAIDQVHNGGYWMNKYGSSANDFQQASAGSWVLLFQLADRLYELPPARKAGKQASLTAAFNLAAEDPLPFPNFELTATYGGGKLEWSWKHNASGSHHVVTIHKSVGGGKVQVNKTVKGPNLHIQFSVGEDLLHTEVVQIERTATLLKGA